MSQRSRVSRLLIPDRDQSVSFGECAVVVNASDVDYAADVVIVLAHGDVASKGRSLA